MCIYPFSGATFRTLGNPVTAGVSGCGYFTPSPDVGGSWFLRNLCRKYVCGVKLKLVICSRYF